MNSRVVTWSASLAPLGACVVAIGVFDGVHIGHQALLESAVGDARRLGCPAVAITFDRDPDQVVSPATAAPQLLVLDDKECMIAATGIDTILVVPFTPELAKTEPPRFVESVLLDVLDPRAVHVGRDFRFGRAASGDVETLRQVLAGRSTDVIAHELVAIDGAPVTSTRIRSLVAEGRVTQAARLLGRPTRVTGIIRHGRGEGNMIGFPTANVAPVAFAAVPGDGVYAGTATLANGLRHLAAISVGKPPMFPDAEDYLEAHLLDFAGDLYGETVTLEFQERLRGQQRYPSLEALAEAIRTDAARTLAIVGDGEESLPEPELLSDGSLAVDDPDALEAAERAVHDSAAVYFEDVAVGEWEPLLDSLHLGEAWATGSRAFMVTAQLDAAGIPYVWDPYPPESRPTSLPGGGFYPQPFTLLVPRERLQDAKSALSNTASAAGETLPVTARSDGPAEGWVYVVHGLHYDKQRLEAIEAALASANIDRTWEPYEPNQAPLLRLGIWGTERFSVAVPESELDAAHALLDGLSDPAE